MKKLFMLTLGGVYNHNTLFLGFLILLLFWLPFIFTYFLMTIQPWLSFLLVTLLYIYTGDTVLLVNTPTQAVSLLDSLEKAAGNIGLHVNADKTEHMCINQKGDISILKGGSLKVVDKFTYFGNSVSSRENTIDT